MTVENLMWELMKLPPGMRVAVEYDGGSSEIDRCVQIRVEDVSGDDIVTKSTEFTTQTLVIS